MRKAVVMIGFLALMLPGGPAAQAQSNPGPGSAPEAGPAQPLPKAAPLPSRPQTSPPQADTLPEDDGAPRAQEGCPDRGVKLERIV